MSAKQCFAQVLRVLLPLCAALSLSAAEAVRITPVGKVEKKTDSELGVDYWDLQANSAEARLKVVVRVSPTKQTFLTVRHKGGGGTGGVAFLCDENGTECKPYCNLDESGLYGRRPGSFFYQTIGIPMELTKGKKRITVHIGATGGGARGIYEVHTHTNPLFRPAADTNHGRIVKPYEFPRFKPLPRRLLPIAKKKTLELMGNQCDRNAQEQLWAPDWRKKVKNGEWPANLVGGFCVPIIRKEDGSFDLQEMKNRITAHYARTNNQGPLIDVGVMAIAYSTPGVRQHKDKVLLERIALGLDFIRRAQAENGAFYSVWSPGVWVGGPKRIWASGTPLEGNGHRGFGYAVWLTADDMEKAGLLDEKIDDDCNPDTPPIPRRQAYLDLVSSSAAYLMGRGGHAPNQDTLQLDGLFLQLKALKALKAPKKLYPDMAKLEERVRFSTGAVPPGENTWVSPKGITYEHGGYTCEYGRDQVTMYYRLFQHAGYKFAKERARIAGYGFSHFVYPVYAKEGTLGWSICAFLNTRHRNFIAGDGFGPCPYQALVFHNPIHIRLFQLEWMNLTEDDIRKWTHPSGGNWWHSGSLEFMRSAGLRLKLLEEFTDPKSPLCADVHLPTEHGQPNFVWSDEGAQVVSLKDGDRRAMLSFNQWHGEFGTGFSFIDFQSPEYDQFLRIPHGVERDAEGRILFRGLQTLVLGDWFIAMNGAWKENKTVEIPDSFAQDAKSLVDLATGKKIPKRFKLPPQTTVVVKKLL